MAEDGTEDTEVEASSITGADDGSRLDLISHSYSRILGVFQPVPIHVAADSANPCHVEITRVEIE